MSHGGEVLTEINFDGIIGPSHNYAGLSLGNLASAKNGGGISHPRAAALQGLEKMRANLRLGLTQGVFMPLDRPNRTWLETLGTSPETADASLLDNALSASSMWAANAATVSPAPDTADGKCHLTVANLMTMPHRSHEWPGTLAQLKLAFADPAFAVHGPVPAPFGDEGAANHMRLCASHGQRGVEVFVYGRSGGPFPARQSLAASKAVARLHGLDPSRTLFVEQSERAIAAGAFHTDVVAVANEHVLFTHEEAFADKERFYDDLRQLLPEIEILEVNANAVSLQAAISTYVFNSQLVTLPGGPMALVMPTESAQHEGVWNWLTSQAIGGGPIYQLNTVDVRQSMANGGGPACLRLRVVCDPATVDPRFLVNEAALDRIEKIIAANWPETIDPADMASPALWATIKSARLAMLEALDLLALA